MTRRGCSSPGPPSSRWRNDALYPLSLERWGVGRIRLRGQAMMVIGLDDPVPAHVMEEIRALSHIESARLATLAG